MDTASLEPTCFALDTNKACACVDHELVALVGTPGEKDPIAVAHKLGENRRLGALADVDGVVRQLGLSK